eukprot:889663-Pleurochrysis_carterae.AAC.1
MKTFCVGNTFVTRNYGTEHEKERENRSVHWKLYRKGSRHKIALNVTPLVAVINAEYYLALYATMPDTYQTRAV